MTEVERGLLQAIFEDIDDDTPRLVYADFLEERGDPRGEFIRLQVLRHRRPEYRRHEDPSPREAELLEQHREEWRREAEPFDPLKFSLKFERGFIATAYIHEGTDECLAVLRRLPGLRELFLDSCEVGRSGVVSITSLPHLRLLVIDRRTSIAPEGLVALAALPCGARVLCEGGSPDRAAWATLQERRIAKYDGLPPAERRKAALRFFVALSGMREPIRAVRIENEVLDDAEMRNFREVPELETVKLSGCAGSAGGGLRHLAGLPNLRSVAVSRADIDSISPLTECPALEELSVGSSGLTDAGTAGLDRLTGLRTLWLLAGDLGASTVERLRPLRRLRDLRLDLRPLTDDRLSALSGLTDLESLAINEASGFFGLIEGGLPVDVLRHLAPLTNLRSLRLHLGPDGGGEFRHLAGLTGLRFLQLNGPCVTDAAISHLGTLRELRTLFIQHSTVTEAGAIAVAARLPAVTIITSDHVIKTPRRSMVFRRQAVGNWASFLVPEVWQEYRTHLGAREDGWEDVQGQAGNAVGPADVWFHPVKEDGPTTPLMALQRETGIYGRTLTDEAGPRIEWDGWETATVICRAWNHAMCLICAGVRGGQSLTICCNAPEARFAILRPLFLLIARSVRLGISANEDIDERIEIFVADFATHTF